MRAGFRRSGFPGLPTTPAAAARYRKPPHAVATIAVSVPPGPMPVVRQTGSPAIRAYERPPPPATNHKESPRWRPMPPGHAAHHGVSAMHALASCVGGAARPEHLLLLHRGLGFLDPPRPHFGQRAL